MVPLVHLGPKNALGLAGMDTGDEEGDLLGALKMWKQSLKDGNKT
jgi:hypothetical protein